MAKTSTNDIFDKTSFLHGSNATYIEQMYEKYQTDPNQIPEEDRDYYLERRYPAFGFYAKFSLTLKSFLRQN